MSANVDIRMAGLGGQGVVTAAHILGTAVVSSGKYALVNPFFGAEKRLAPTESYVRIAAHPVHDRGEILYPNCIMIFAPEVITMGKSYTMPFYAGLKEDGLVLINAEQELLSEREKSGLDALNAKVFYIPATKLAMEFAGTELATNMTMLGALCGFIELVGIDAVMDAVEERFGGKVKFVASGTTAALDDSLKGKYDKISLLIEKNSRAIEKAFEYVQQY